MKRIGFWMASIGVCALVLAGGCAKKQKAAKSVTPEQEKITTPETKAAKESKASAAQQEKKPTGKPVTLAEKFNTGDTGTYKVVNETIKDYKYEQPSINQTKTQQTLNRTEVVFEQKIQNVDPSGNASALITLKELKYTVKNPKGAAVDFDSTKDADKSKPLGNLIGKTYVVTLSPDGNVVAISDTQAAFDAVKGDSMEHKIGQSLLSDDMIRQRHIIAALPASKDSQVAVGQNWSKLKASPAGMLVPKSYENVYTLKEIKKADSQQIAVVDMEARPTTAKVPGTQQEEAAKGMGFFSKMFDNKETYKGQMLLDLKTGKVNGSSESLKSEWVAMEPAEEVKSDKGPDVLTMGFTYNHSIEKLQ